MLYLKLADKIEEMINRSDRRDITSVAIRETLQAIAIMLFELNKAKLKRIEIENKYDFR